MISLILSSALLAAVMVAIFVLQRKQHRRYMERHAKVDQEMAKAAGVAVRRASRAGVDIKAVADSLKHGRKP